MDIAYNLGGHTIHKSNWQCFKRICPLLEDFAADSHFIPVTALVDFHQLDREVQRGATGNHSLYPAFAVAEFWRDDQYPRFALAHSRNAALIALDNLELKCDQLL